MSLTILMGQNIIGDDKNTMSRIVHSIIIAVHIISDTYRLSMCGWTGTWTWHMLEAIQQDMACWSESTVIGSTATKV